MGGIHLIINDIENPRLAALTLLASDFILYCLITLLIYALPISPESISAELWTSQFTHALTSCEYRDRFAPVATNYAAIELTDF